MARKAVAWAVRLALILSASFLAIPTLTRAGVHSAESLVGAQSKTFTLTDQYNRPHTIAFPMSKPLVLMLGDRGGSKQIEPWVRELYQRYGDSIEIQGVAILRGVPPLIRPMIRSQLRSRAPKSVLLDWSGNVADMYHCRSDVCNVVVIDRQGRIATIVRGGVSAERSRLVCQALDRIR
ncbi:MAG: hypothetical protein NZ585_03795 [Chloracidobacterium sp.]|nr:hypothetical protein [Chloracidobacterium sp.]MDW8217521.1 hypothetical protein [Acidobacteriota bacterium]